MVSRFLAVLAVIAVIVFVVFILFVGRLHQEEDKEIAYCEKIRI